MKMVQGPVRLWLSNASQRALRLTASNRTDMPRSGAGSQLNLKGSLESNRNAIYSHPAPRERHTAWAGANRDTYPLQQWNTTNGGVWKKTEIQISEAHFERTEHGSNSAGNGSVNFSVVDRVREKKAQQAESDELDLDSLYILE